MKDLKDYITEQLSEGKGVITYDEKKHITGVEFASLSDMKDCNILTDIMQAGLGMMISPEEEEFEYQWMTIYWDKNLIEFYMPNNITNDTPMGFNFKIKIDKAAMDRWMNGNYDWQVDDFSLYQAPSAFVKMSRNIDTSKFKTQLYTLIAMVMNRQPEPLW